MIQCIPKHVPPLKTKNRPGIRKGGGKEKRKNRGGKNEEEELEKCINTSKNNHIYNSDDRLHEWVCVDTENETGDGNWDGAEVGKHGKRLENMGKQKSPQNKSQRFVK